MTSAEDWTPKAETKALVSGAGDLTMAQLETAIQGLNKFQPPGSAKVKLNQSANGWSIVATWPLGIPYPPRSTNPAPAGLRLAEDAEATARKIQGERGRGGRWLTCSVCGERITPTAGHPGEYVHMAPPPAASDHLVRLDTQG